MITYEEFNKWVQENNDDVAYVVRCKDCVYFTHIFKTKCKLFNEFTTEYDYCSRGERRIEE